MRLLLDTQAFFWVVHPRHEVPPHVVETLDAAGSVVLVSDISAYEVSLKAMRGRFADAAELAANWVGALARLGAESLSVNTNHALRAGQLAWAHRDPFDRIIAAQAQVEGLTVVTSDRALIEYSSVDTLRW